MPEILSNINWIDILYVILLLGMVYKGSRTGVSGQIFSLIGWIALMFCSFRYYVFLSEAIFGFMLQKWAKPLTFFGIAAGFFVVIKVLERVFNIVASEELSPIERIGGALVACVRASILFGVIGTLLLLMPIDYARRSAAEGSRSCMFFVRMDSAAYDWIEKMTHRGEEEKKEEEPGFFERLLAETEDR